MPIVDGLTSTKMIRSNECNGKDCLLSSRAALNGRLPVIAVSASLVEGERQTYIDAGFDAWILKPINFMRLKELMAAIVDPKVRVDALYQPGAWEKGGYFQVPRAVHQNCTGGDRIADDSCTSDQKKIPTPQARPLTGKSESQLQLPPDDVL
jgi:hypothetical protein